MADAPVGTTEAELRSLIDGAVELHRAGRLDEAEALYREALMVDAREPNALANLGALAMQRGQLETGVELIGASLAVKPAQPWALVNQAGALAHLGRTEDAVAAYRKALDLDADNPQVHHALGVALSALWRMEEALAAFDRALALEPRAMETRFLRGGVQRELGRFEDALESYEQVLANHPAHPPSLKNRAIVLADLRRHEEALAAFEALEAVAPGDAEADWIRGLVLLMLGRYAEGWRRHEARLPAAQRERQWTGGPVDGATVLVYGEQGLGDTLQMMRYVPLLAARGARVILAVQAPLLSLARSVAGAAEVICIDDPTPAFDLQCPVMSLPLAFDTRLETIPAQVPYVDAPPGRKEAWAERIRAETPQAGLRVGLVWSGGLRPDQPQTWAVNRRRNIPLKRLEPLKTEGAVFYSLQKGAAAEAELAEVRARGWGGPDIVDWTADLHDMGETAALVQNLDLVITVDTSMAHLVGALGKPVWILNRYDSCWRWLQDRPDSPWYPTARLYRQARPHDWTSVVEEVAEALRAAVAEASR